MCNYLYIVRFKSQFILLLPIGADYKATDAELEY